MKRTLLTTFLMLFCALLFAQDSLVNQVLSQHSRPIAVSNNTLSGKGADWLKNQVSDAQFVLVGEDHGLAEIPLFVGALYNDLYAKGFNHFAAEVAPGILSKLENMASQSSLEEFGSLSNTFPLTVPFYNWREEAQMLSNIYKKSTSSPNTIWALDQEFIGSWRYYLQQIADNAPTDDARKLALGYYNKAIELLDNAKATQNFGSNLMFSLTNEDFSKLSDAFKKQPETAALLNSLKESQSIYFKMGSNPYQSNIDRIALMKRNFYGYYNQAKKNDNVPKVILKFGATHMYRGASMLNIFDIGNMASEVANSNGLKSFHILVVGVEGTANRYMVINSTELKQARYDGKVEFKYLGLNPVMELAKGDGWQLIDLFPLKNDIWLNKIKVSKELEKTVFAFDAILMIPHVTASTNF